MNRLYFLYFFFTLCWMNIYAEPKNPVDISYMISDFKYSQEHGLKICEVQSGTISSLRGDLKASKKYNGNIPPMFVDFFSHLPMKKWAVGLIYPSLKRSLASNGWNLMKSIETLSNNPTFLECAAQPPFDPFSISSYSGIVYSNSEVAQNFDLYSKAYPGILFLNAATFPYWDDKYKMNVLFDLNEELKQYKADWRIYPKKYDALLAKRIQEEMPSSYYVIKPRKEALSLGVIVVANEDLDQVLQMILEPMASLETHPDKKYYYWWTNKDDSFLIEKFYRSDYLCYPSPLRGNPSSASEYHYDTTMRLVFILKYDEGKMSYHSLGGYCKIPSKALEQEGTLNEQRISGGQTPSYKTIEPELFNEINTHMERAMLLLYDKMLN